MSNVDGSRRNSDRTLTDPEAVRVETQTAENGVLDDIIPSCVATTRKAQFVQRRRDHLGLYARTNQYRECSGLPKRTFEPSNSAASFHSDQPRLAFDRQGLEHLPGRSPMAHLRILDHRCTYVESPVYLVQIHKNRALRRAVSFSSWAGWPTSTAENWVSY